MIKKHDNNNCKSHCMVVHAYYPLGETRVERQARALIEAGYLVDVICLQDKNELRFEIVDNVNVHRLPVQRHKKSGPLVQLLEYLIFFVLAFVKLTRLHWQRHYGVIQIHNLPDFLVFVALIPRLAGRSVILDLHDLMPEFYAARFDKDISHWMVRIIAWQERFSCWFASHVVTVSQLWCDTLVHRGVPAHKVSVVMNVADDQVFQTKAALKSDVISGDALKLIYHGNLTERYGIDLVVNAVNMVRDKIPGIHLTIHGAGEFLEILMVMVDDLGLQDYVDFSTEFIPTPELPLFIQKFNLGLVPYRRDVFTDGILPTKLMEYAALGMPVVAAKTRAIEAYFDESMVQFFTPDDGDDLARSLQELYFDRERLAQISQGIQKFNQRYNWTKLGSEYVALVERLNA